MAVSSFLLLSILKAYSQEDKSFKGLSLSDGYISDRSQVRFNQSSDFVSHYTPGGDRLACTTSKQVRDYNRHYNHILSKDGNFIAHVSVPLVFRGDKDSIYADFSSKTGFMIEVNTYCLEIIKGDFFVNIGERVTSLCDLPLTYKSLEYTRKTHNADTVITYPLRTWENLENKYNHCQVMIIQKKYRGRTALYCFYDDKGARKLSQYIRSLKKVFWYRKPRDYTEVIDPPIIEEYEIPHLKAKEKSANN